MPNVPWSRDELILALDLYFSIHPRAPDPSSSEIRDLSALLNRLPGRGENRAGNFRSPASVVMKLMNFRSLDPLYPGRGLRASGKLDGEVWRNFSRERDRLHQTALAIRAAIRDNAAAPSDIQVP